MLIGTSSARSSIEFGSGVGSPELERLRERNPLIFSGGFFELQCKKKVCTPSI